MVNELKEPEAAEAGPEEEYAVARALLDSNFMAQLLDRLEVCESVGYQESAESTLLLRLLLQAAHVDVSSALLLVWTMVSMFLAALAIWQSLACTDEVVAVD